MTAGGGSPSGSAQSGTPRSAGGGRRRKPVVAVTGAAEGLGATVAELLGGTGHFRQVIGLDSTRGTADGITWRRGDVRDPRVVESLSGVDAVVHLAVSVEPGLDRTDQRDLNLRGTTVLVTAAAAAGVKRVVLITSAMVYGALADNPVPLPDDAPLRAQPEPSPLGDLLEIERMAERLPRAHPGLEVVVLRPALLVGDGVPAPAGGLLDAPRLLMVRGARPHWQFCHVEDLTAAVDLAARGEVSGPATVASDGWLSQDDVERITGSRRLELPSTMAFGTAERLHRIGLSGGPPSELSYLVHPWAVCSERLRAAGWTARYGNEEALTAYVESRSALPRARIGRGVAVGAGAAAGATVAIVGTAALVRRARRKKQGRG
jgi:nucleoside-diphosphate-sugar epimerase